MSIKSVILAASIAVLLLTGACRSPLVPIMAAANVAIGAGVAGARRAQGMCYTWCAPGTKCNPANGLCEPLPCYGQCKQGEVCVENAAIPKCVPVTDDTMTIMREGQDPQLP